MKDPTRLALVLLGVSLVALIVLSSRTPLGPLSSDYAALVNQAEDSIHGFAQIGTRVFEQPKGRAALEQLTKRPLAPMLSAWSALSIGRVGLLDGSSSVRLPWLILAAAMPLSLFLLLRQRAGTVTAFGAGFWLFSSPGFVSSALAVRPSALAVWSGWLVLVVSVCTVQVRTVRARSALLILCGALACLAFGLSFRALWVVPLLLIHAWSARPRGTLLAARHGHLPVPTTALLVIGVLPVAVVVFDPLLWHAEVPALIRRVFDEEDPVRSVVATIRPFVLPGLLALVGLSVLARDALARRFATGEFRPRRDPRSVGLLLTLAGLWATLSCSLGAATGQEFGAELLRPVLACWVAIGAASLASRWFARHARLVEVGLLLLTLLAR
ncbi:MAG TPA: hypothetical protein VNW92_04015 [Polyangiaceae bacterium]|jgi:hypothetical protein|nr:hypothetical protein [Polyangiaceae bacterium]